MIVDTLITGVAKYFTSTSVDSIWGYKKVSLLEIDDNKIPTGMELTIDATTSASVSISKSLMQHNSESKKVYMDGTKINPVKMSIRGHIETTKLAELQRFAQDDVWMYVSMTKDMGGSKVSMDKQSQIGRVVALATDVVDFLAGTPDGIQLYDDCKPYIIQSLSISDDGFINTVEVSIELVEVVLFEYDLAYIYGTKQNKGGGKGSKVQQAAVQKEVEAPPLKTHLKLYDF